MESNTQRPHVVRGTASHQRVRGKGAAHSGATTKTVKGGRRYRGYQSPTRPQSGSPVAGPITVRKAVAQ